MRNAFHVVILNAAGVVAIHTFTAKDVVRRRMTCLVFTAVSYVTTGLMGNQTLSRLALKVLLIKRNGLHQCGRDQ